MSDEQIYDLHMLGWDLAEEAHRRLCKVEEAWELWQEREQANRQSKAAKSHDHRKEKASPKANGKAE